MSSEKKNGQSAVEFILIVSFASLAFVAILAVLTSQYQDVDTTSTWSTAEYIGQFYVVSETDRAVDAPVGYQRTFVVPERHNGIPFTIQLIDTRELVVIYEDFEYVTFLPVNVTGSLIQGQNTLYKGPLGYSFDSVLAGYNAS